MPRRKNAGRPAKLEVADRLHSAAIHLLRRVRQKDVAAGIGAAQLSALSVLVFGGPKTPGELARAEQVKPPTMTRIVLALEQEGLARRVPDPQDRRVARIHATPRGVEVMQKGRSRRINEVAELLRELSPKQVRSLGKAIELLERALRQARC
ncbi:MAG: MarR family transcriptional regulator [Acidobacteriales bacterium]|nr:MarR family transcriptional regulator [Terriglobales bacterium]